MDSAHQSLVLQLMVVCPEDVCKVRTITCTVLTIHFYSKNLRWVLNVLHIFIVLQIYYFFY